MKRVVNLARLTAGMVLCSCLVLLIACQSGSKGNIEKTMKSPDNAATVKQKNTQQLAPGDKRYTKEIFDKVDVEKDIIYREVKNYKGENEKIKLDVYQPSGDTQPNRPAMIIVHGGGMVSGSKDDEYLRRVAEDFTKKGYVVIKTDYRLRADQSKYIEAMHDAADDTAEAVKWVIANSEKYRIDSKHLVLLGHSVGSDIISDMCYNDQRSGKWQEDSVFSTIVIAGGGLPQKVANAKPQKGDPPCLVLQGTFDEYYSYKNAEDFAQTLKAANVQYTFHSLKDGKHDFTDDIYEVEDVAAWFLYKELIGKDAGITVRSNKQFALAEIKQRLAAGKTYTAKQISFNADGNLDEWENSEVIAFDQLADWIKEPLPKTDFSGTAMIGWNQNNPTRIYIAATITDNVITNNIPADGWWRADDSLEIRTDLSSDTALSQMIWAVGAAGDLSELASKDSTECKVVRKGNTSVYEIALDLSKANPQSQDTKKIANNFKITAGKTIGMDGLYADVEKDYYIAGWVKGDFKEDRMSYMNVTFDSARTK